jgi:hypothetical protein
MKIKKMLSCLILTIIFQNSLIIKTYASEYQVIKIDNRQLRFKIFNAPNTPPTHTNNTVEWFYNSLNQKLSPFSEVDTINVIKKSMQSWSDISGINFVYKGTTDNNINDSTDGIITIGFWSSNAYMNQHGDSGAFTAVEWENFNITEGHMILNAGDASNSSSIPSNLLELQGLITHEVGHLLAIAHSDNQESIMFADPYHSYEYQSILRSDDIQIASQLYPVNSNDLLTTVKSNFDIVIQSATFHSANDTSNIWAILEFNGTDSNGNLIWQLKNYGQNGSKTTDSLTTVRSNFDIVILSATFQSPENPSNIWAVLEFNRMDSDGNLFWQLKNYGQN